MFVESALYDFWIKVKSPSVFFNFGDTGSQLSSRVWSVSVLGVVFNLGDMEPQLSPRVWSVSVLGVVLT